MLFVYLKWCVDVFMSFVMGALSNYWPSVEGEVISEGIDEVESFDDEDVTWYRPKIRYKYKTKQGAFESERLLFIDWSTSDIKEARLKTVRIVKSGFVKVYYNPFNHSSSVLLNGLRYDYLIKFKIHLLVSVFVIPCLVQAVGFLYFYIFQ